MKKITSILGLILISTMTFSQTDTFKYIQVNASVDLLGNIKMMSIEKPPKKSKTISDTTVNFRHLNSLVLNSKNAIEAINLLSTEGWVLVSIVALSKVENGGPNSPFVAYYFRKDF